MSKKIIIFTFLMVFVFAATFAVSAELTIKLAHEEPGNAEVSSIHTAALVFKNIVETQSNG